MLSQYFLQVNLNQNLLIITLAYWVDIRARRNFFENYAKAHSFDHQHAPSWYSQSIEDILATKVLLVVFIITMNSL